MKETDGREGTSDTCTSTGGHVDVEFTAKPREQWRPRRPERMKVSRKGGGGEEEDERDEEFEKL